MAGEKTEKATPKKRRDARKEGNVFKSVEINNSITIIAAVLGFTVLWKSMLEGIKELFVFMISKGYQTYGLVNDKTFSRLLILCGKTITKVCGPLVILIMISGIAANYAQVGFLFVPKSIKPKAERISMLSGFKRIFSMKTLKDLIKSLLKISAVCVIAYSIFKPLIEETPSVMLLDLDNSIEYGVSKSLNIAFKILLAMVTISIIDYIFQFFEHEKKLKMSKQEIKDEYKTTEGNPEIKSRIKDTQRQFAMSRMMQQIPNADVVITNPTHYAVAIKYDRIKDNAPIVVAKGADLIAQKIKEIARENKIEIVESKELARSLFKTTEIGQEIPYELFNAVAEILAYIYTMKEKKKY